MQLKYQPASVGSVFYVSGDELLWEPQRRNVKGFGSRNIRSESEEKKTKVLERFGLSAAATSGD